MLPKIPFIARRVNKTVADSLAFLQNRYFL